MVSDEHKGKQFIHLTPEAIADMKSAASAGQMHAEMFNHAQQTPTSLSNPSDLTHHLLTAHEWDDNDMHRNSHWRDIDHVVQPSDDDRRMSHTELRRVHDDEHAANPQDFPHATTLGDSHFHDA